MVSLDVFFPVNNWKSLRQTGARYSGFRCPDFPKVIGATRLPIGRSELVKHIWFPRIYRQLPQVWNRSSGNWWFKSIQIPVLLGSVDYIIIYIYISLIFPIFHSNITKHIYISILSDCSFREIYPIRVISLESPCSSIKRIA